MDTDKRKTSKESPTLACVNCGVTSTTVWRKGGHDAKTCCNACGLYFKRHGAFPTKDGGRGSGSGSNSTASTAAAAAAAAAGNSKQGISGTSAAAGGAVGETSGHGTSQALSAASSSQQQPQQQQQQQSGAGAMGNAVSSAMRIAPAQQRPLGAIPGGAGSDASMTLHGQAAVMMRAQSGLNGLRPNAHLLPRGALPPHMHARLMHPHAMSHLSQLGKRGPSDMLNDPHGNKRARVPDDVSGQAMAQAHAQAMAHMRQQQQQQQQQRSADQGSGIVNGSGGGNSNNNNNINNNNNSNNNVGNKSSSNGSTSAADNGSSGVDGSSNAAGCDGGATAKLPMAHRCSNCNVDRSMYWRHGPDNTPLCNPCGLYYQAHGTQRPLDAFPSMSDAAALGFVGAPLMHAAAAAAAAGKVMPPPPASPGRVKVEGPAATMPPPMPPLHHPPQQEIPVDLSSVIGQAFVGFIEGTFSLPTAERGLLFSTNFSGKIFKGLLFTNHPSTGASADKTVDTMIALGHSITSRVPEYVAPVTKPGVSASHGKPSSAA